MQSRPDARNSSPNRSIYIVPTWTRAIKRRSLQSFKNSSNRNPHRGSYKQGKQKPPGARVARTPITPLSGDASAASDLGLPWRLYCFHPYRHLGYMRDENRPPSWRGACGACGAWGSLVSFLPLARPAGQRKLEGFSNCPARYRPRCCIPGPVWRGSTATLHTVRLEEARSCGVCQPGSKSFDPGAGYKYVAAPSFPVSV